MQFAEESKSKTTTIVKETTLISYCTIETISITMGLFTKKQSTAVETVGTETRKPHRRRGKWICGSRSSKDVEIMQKNSSYSTDSSSDDEKRDGNNRRSKSSGERQQIDPRATLPPSAAASAFQGRPRFDWIDVVCRQTCE